MKLGNILNLTRHMTELSKLSRLVVRGNWLALAAIALWLNASRFAHAENLGKGTIQAENRGLGAVQRPNKPSFRSAPPTGSTGPIGSPLIYWGGELIQTPVVYVLWYGNWNSTDGSDTPAGQQIIRDFLNSIGGSPYFNINQTYSTNGYTVTGNVVFGGEYYDAGSKGTTLSDASITAIVNHALTSGTSTNKALPYNPNGIYFVMTSAANINYSGFCSSFCGWHTSDPYGASNLRYAFVGNSKKCLSSCAIQTTKSPNNNPGVDGMISVIAHELEETVTDPENGYWDANGNENGDKCAWTFGTTYLNAAGAYYNVTLGSRQYLIQRNIGLSKNGNDYCVMSSSQIP